MLHDKYSQNSPALHRSPDGTTAVPTAEANITLSPLSFWHSDSASFVFRCQNCALQGEVDDGKVTLGAVLSHIAPPFVVGHDNETVTMTNAIIAPFTVDFTAITRGDYVELLKVAGLAS